MGRAIAPDTAAAPAISGSLQQQGNASDQKIGTRPKQGSVQFVSGLQSAKSSIPGSKGAPQKLLDSSAGVTYEEEELETLKISESCCPPAAADSPLAVSNCHMLHFLAQLGHQHARTDATLLKQSSVLSDKADTTAGGLSKAAAPRPGNKFAQIVAQASEACCRLGLKCGSPPTNSTRLFTNSMICCQR